MLALLSYPVVIEPLLPLKPQADSWAAEYGLLAVLILTASAAALRARSSVPTLERQRAEDRLQAQPVRPGAPSRVGWGLRLRWIAAAAIPASLMLGTTTNISTDIAAAPFLWVLPLALYLGTFIIVFDRKRALPLRATGAVHTLLLVAVRMFTVLLRHHISATVGINLALFFVSALICHARLAAHRPAPDRLTEFYICMSLGGVVGGGLTALAAPVVFATVFEYPLMLAAACLLLPGAVGRGKALLTDVEFGAGAFAPAAPIVVSGTLFNDLSNVRAYDGVALFGLLPLACFYARTRPVKAAATALAMAATAHFLLPQFLSGSNQQVISRDRSFFGISTVSAVETEDGPVRRFSHGDTVHNTQLRIEGQTRVPLACHSVEGPFGDIIRAARAATPHPAVAVIGLGAGALSCYARPGEDWTFFEIDPAVVRLATDPGRFSYVSECAPDSRIVLGEARLNVGGRGGRAVRLVDRRRAFIGFDSGSPVDHGSHRNVPSQTEAGRPFVLPRFQPLSRCGLGCRRQHPGARAGYPVCRLPGRRVDAEPPAENRHRRVSVAPEPGLAAALDGVAGWRQVDPDPGVSAWRDGWSNVFGALLARFRGGVRAVPADRLAQIDGQ